MYAVPSRVGGPSANLRYWIRWIKTVQVVHMNTFDPFEPLARANQIWWQVFWTYLIWSWTRSNPNLNQTYFWSCLIRTKHEQFFQSTAQPQTGSERYQPDTSDDLIKIEQCIILVLQCIQQYQKAMHYEGLFQSSVTHLLGSISRKFSGRQQ